MLRLLKLYCPYTAWLLLGLFLALITLLANVGLMAISGWFIASMAIAGTSSASINYFTPAAIIRGLAIIRTVGRYAERIVTHEATFRLIAKLRVWFYTYIEPLAPAALQNQRSGDLLSRLQKDIDRLDAIYLRIALPLLVAVLSIVIFTFSMAIQSPLLALSNLFFLLIGGLALPLWINHLAQQPGKQQVIAAATMRTQVIDGVQGMAELISHNADQQQAAKIAACNQHWLSQQDKINQAQSLAQAGQNLLANLSVFMVLLLAIPMIIESNMPPANLAMLALFTLASFEAIAPLPNAFALIAETREAATRIFTIIDTPNKVDETSNPISITQLEAIRFKQVSLHYNAQAPAALSNINLSFPIGSCTLITGSSGSGKSSLVNLLLRFWQPTNGMILWGEHNIAAFDSEQLRAQFSVVSQNTQLINGSLRKNLLIAKPRATESELIEACAQAQLDDFIKEQTNGLDTWLGETGIKLSSGQARRVTIARAILKNAPILLLDEPTEGLDQSTEKQINQALEKLMKNRTVILITHRPLNIGHIDQHIHLDSGHIL